MPNPLLSAERVKHYATQLVSTDKATPCRFLRDGRAVDLITGRVCSAGSNVLYHPVYWNFSRETARAIAAECGLKVVFSE